MPISGRSAPALRILSARVFVDRFTLCQERSVESCMTLGGGDEADRAVAVLVVVPAHQVIDPTPGLDEIDKRLCRVVRTVFRVLKSDSE